MKLYLSSVICKLFRLDVFETTLAFHRVLEQQLTVRNQVGLPHCHSCLRKSLLRSFLSGERGIQKETVFPTSAQVRDGRTLWGPSACLREGLLRRWCGPGRCVSLGLPLTLSFAHKMGDSSDHSPRTKTGTRGDPLIVFLLSKAFKSQVEPASSSTVTPLRFSTIAQAYRL